MHKAGILFTGAVTLAAVAGMPSEAAASGLSVARFGGEHGHPTTTNATAVFYNPAGIGFSEKTHLFGDVILAWRSSSYTHPGASTNDVVTPGEPNSANYGEGKLFNVLASPMLGVTTKLGDLALGAAFYTPYGGQGSYDKNDALENDPNYVGGYDGVQRWYAIDGTLRSSFISLAVAYQMGRLSIGVGGNLILTTVDTLRARNADGSNNLATEGRSYLNTKGLNFSFSGGVMFEAIEEELWVGASYQSQPIGGEMKTEGELTTVFAGSATTSDVDFYTSLPDVIRAGGKWKVDEQLELRLFGDYTRWSVMENQCVVAQGSPCVFGPNKSTNNEVILNQARDWHDTWGVRAGASYWTSDELEVFAGAGFSSNAVPDETQEPALADFDSFSLGLGARVEVVEDLHVAGSYNQVFYLPRDTEGKSEHGTYAARTTSPDSGGTYKQMVGFVNINVDFAF